MAGIRSNGGMGKRLRKPFDQFPQVIDLPQAVRASNEQELHRFHGITSSALDRGGVSGSLHPVMAQLHVNGSITVDLVRFVVQYHQLTVMITVEQVDDAFHDNGAPWGVDGSRYGNFRPQLRRPQSRDHRGAPQRPIGQSGNVPGAGRYPVILGALLGKLFNPRIQYGEYVIHRSIVGQRQPIGDPVHGHLQHFMQRTAEGCTASPRAVSRLAISFCVLIFDIRLVSREGFGDARRGNSLGKRTVPHRFGAFLLPNVWGVFWKRGCPDNG